MLLVVAPGVRRSIVKVHALLNRYPEMVIVPAHDRRIHDKIAIFPQVEGELTLRDVVTSR